MHINVFFERKTKNQLEIRNEYQEFGKRKIKNKIKPISQKTIKNNSNITFNCYINCFSPVLADFPNRPF